MASVRNAARPLFAALLAVAIIGPLSWRGAEGAAVELQATTRTVTIPASAFNPMSDIVPYSRGAGYLETRSGSGVFLAPVFFEAPVVSIRKVVFYAIDAGPGSIQMELIRTQPAEQKTLSLGSVLTAGSLFSMQVITLSNLAERRISGAYGATLSVYLPGPFTDGYRLVGAKVTYSY